MYVTLILDALVLPVKRYTGFSLSCRIPECTYINLYILQARTEPPIYEQNRVSQNIKNQLAAEFFSETPSSWVFRG